MTRAMTLKRVALEEDTQKLSWDNGSDDEASHTGWVNNAFCVDK